MEVFALVGPSGTGKSHRAAVVANNCGARTIIDDGLLIHNSRIIAGVSAKSQPTKLGAIKAALFMNEVKAGEITQKLAEINPEKILLLGTSQKMVLRITQRLGLPSPAKIIMIEEVASEKEIRKARFHRNKYYKHVIPAPAMEVERSLPGIFVDPLRIFLRRRETTGKKDWVEKSVVRPTRTFEGKLVITDSAISAIVSIAAKEVEGVAAAGKVKITAEREGSLLVEIFPVINYGVRLRLTARKLQRRIKEVVEYMTGLQVRQINVEIKTVIWNS